MSLIRNIWKGSTIMTDEEYLHYVYVQAKEFMSHENKEKEFSAPVKDRVAYFFDLCKIDSGCNVLDAGCGDGLAMQEIGLRGFKNIFGIDLSEEKALCARALGFDVKVADLHKINTKEYKRKFSVIYSSHTLEHCYDPLLVLEKLRSLLTDNGALFLTVPFPDRAEALHVHCGAETLKTLHGNKEEFFGVLRSAGFEPIADACFDIGNNHEIRVILQKKKK